MIQADQPTIFDTQKVITGISSRQDGNMKFSPYEPVEQTIKNRRNFLAKLDIDIAQTVYMFVGSPHAWDVIYDVQATDLGVGIIDQSKAIVVDALLTNQPGQALFLPIADCNPVIMHDPVRQVLALVHLGWQSTVADLAFKTVTHMMDFYHTEPADIRVYFGPAIKPQSYTFSDDITQANDPAWIPYLVKIKDEIGIDLPGFNQQRLVDAGLQAEHITISTVDTATAKNYFSNYRARKAGQDNEGRFAATCMLR